MSGPALLDRMTALAAKRRDDLLASARAEAERVIAEAHRQVEARRHEAQLAARQTAEHTRARRLAQAEQQAEKEALTLRDRVVADVLDQARQRAMELADTPQFEPILKALVREVVRDAPQNAVLEAPAAHAARCRQWLDAWDHRGVRVETSTHLRDGVALRDEERTWRVLNTLTGRFDRVLGQARRLCMHRLFEETRDAGA